MTDADAVVSLLVRNSPYGVSSAEISQRTGIDAEVLATVLEKLETTGQINSGWEKPEPSFEPRRRVYWTKPPIPS